MTDAPGRPLIGDVTFRLSEDGRMLGLDFECLDGKVRGLAAPVGIVPVLLAGFLWSGAESGEKTREGANAPPALRERLRDGARAITGWRVVEDGPDALLEIECGAGLLCLRVPGGDATALAGSLPAFLAMA